MSVFLIGQKLAENAKIETINCDILGDFQTLCSFGKLKIEAFYDRLIHCFDSFRGEVLHCVL